jgi:hypothetical protein
VLELFGDDVIRCQCHDLPLSGRGGPGCARWPRRPA